MAEINNVIAEASQDLQTIEDFVNLPADSEVYPRLLPSVNVGTLAGARQAIFEAGGLPATPFATKALMTASALVDGKYAQVTDDTVNNGLYVKTAGVWVKSNYDPLTRAKTYTDTSFSEIVFKDGWSPVTYETFNDFIIDSAPANPMFKPFAGGQYIKIDARGLTQIRITGSKNIDSWFLHYVNAEGTRLSISTMFGDNTYTIPPNTVYIYRTYKVGTTIDNSIVIEGDRRNRITKSEQDIVTLKSSVSGIIGTPIKVNADIAPIAGASVNTGENPVVLAPASGRSYIKVKVDDVASVTVSGARTDISSWLWVFTDENLNKISTGTVVGNGSFNIPSNAYYMLRTYEVQASGVTELPTLAIELSKKTKSISSAYTEINARIDTLSSDKTDLASRDFGKQAAIMSALFANGNTLKLSSFEGATSHIKIDNAIAFIKKRGYGILDLESGVHIRNSAILVPSNCWIYLNDAELKLADGVFDNLIRNEGIVPNTDPFEPATALNENRNIRVFGNGIKKSAISGPDVPYTAPHPVSGGDAIPWTGDFYGWRTLLVLLANVKDYKLHDFKTTKTMCWAITQEHGCENFAVHDIDFQTTVKNGDGIDVRQGCKDGDIYNISGYTLDDMIALSAIKNFTAVHPFGVYVYPMQVGGYGDRGFGFDITDININSVKGSGDNNGVRLLASGGSKVQRISVDNISDGGGAFGKSMVLVSSGYGTPSTMGDITNITVNGIKSALSMKPLKLDGDIKDSAFNDISQARAAGVIVEDTANKDNVTITNARRV